MIEDVIALYEVNGLQPQEIATALGLELEVVKLTLRDNSSIYRDENKIQGVEDVSDEEFAKIKKELKNLTLTTGNEFLKMQGLKFLWNEKKGRNEVKTPVMVTNVVINQINQRLRAINNSREVSIDPAEQTPA